MKKYFALVFILVSLVFPESLDAKESFLTSYNVTYNVFEKTPTRVQFEVALTNTTSLSYASSYSITLSFKNIENVKASDADGNITPQVSKKDDGQKIDLVFNKRVVGMGNTLYFNLSFDTTDVAKKVGNIWEINIPGLTNQDEFSSFNVHVRVPSSFGKPIYIKPKQTENTLDFTKDDLGKSGISIAFGEKQYYSFTLKYHLENNNLFPITTEIALPPSTNYQNVFIESIDPKPRNVINDEDDNWLAQYQISPSDKKDITVKGMTEISLFPKKQFLSNEQQNKYLISKQYWQTQDLRIKTLAERLKTPAAIYEYVVKTLNYDYSRVTENKPRLGALGVLDKPSSAVCLEFTDLFIAIARAAGIPAREVDGFAYTQNSKQRPLSLVKDILHAWPEYYDKESQAWIMVDPTWGKTSGIDYFSTFDFDHFAFVIKGVNSSYPIPAGGYKLAAFGNTKDVEVTLVENKPSTLTSFDLKLNQPAFILSGLPVQGSITIKNTGNTILEKQNFTISASDIFEDMNVTFDKIPPFGFSTNKFSFGKTPFLTKKSMIITIRGSEKLISQKVEISPIPITWWTILGGVFIAILGITLSIIIARTWDLPFFRQKR